MAFDLSPMHVALSLLGGAGLCMYFAQRTLWNRITSINPNWTGLRGILLGLPIAFFAVAAIFNGQTGLAVSAIISCGVLGLTLVMGVTCISSNSAKPIVGQRLRTIVPLAVAIVLCGMRSYFTFTHAIILGGIGFMTNWGMTSKTHISHSPQSTTDRSRYTVTDMIALVLGIMLIVLGAYFGISFVNAFQSATSSNMLSPLAVLMIVPFLMLGTLGLASAESHFHDPAQAVDSIAAMVWSLLGIILPMMILLSFWMNKPTNDHDLSLYWTSIFQGNKGAAYPLVTWRVDSLVLMVISLMLLPVSLGRFALGMIEGWVLIIAFAIYVIVAVTTGVSVG